MFLVGKLSEEQTGGILFVGWIPINNLNFSKPQKDLCGEKQIWLYGMDLYYCCGVKTFSS